MNGTLSPAQAAEVVEFGEGEAYADFFFSAPAELGVSVQRLGSAMLLVAQRLDIVLFNRVIGLGLREPASDTALEAILSIYRQAGVHASAGQLSPAAQPPVLSLWLEARGLRPADNWAKVYRAADPEMTMPTGRLMREQPGEWIVLRLQALARVRATRPAGSRASPWSLLTQSLRAHAQ